MNIFKKIGEKLKSGQGMSKKVKRNLLLSASILIVCAAVFLNWRLSGGDGVIDGIVAADAGASASSAGEKILGDSVEVSGEKDEDYFAVSVVSRERVRDEAIETLREIAYSDEASAENKQTALEKMTWLADAMTKEVNIENLVMAKGFEDCVAVINDDGVNVIVKSSGLMPADIAQIRDIVMDQTGAEISAIKIIEHE